MGRKIYVEVEDRSPFGEDFNEKIYNSPAVDSTFVAGYSDKRTRRELDVRAGKRPEKLPFRLQWANCRDSRNVQRWINQGYKALRYDEAESYGLDLGKNIGIKRGTDGSSYLGDEHILMIAPADVAAANLRKVQELGDQQQRMPAERLERAAADFNAANKGMSVQITEEVDLPKSKKR